MDRFDTVTAKAISNISEKFDNMISSLENLPTLINTEFSKLKLEKCDVTVSQKNVSTVKTVAETKPSENNVLTPKERIANSIAQLRAITSFKPVRTDDNVTCLDKMSTELQCETLKLIQRKCDVIVSPINSDKIISVDTAPLHQPIHTTKTGTVAKSTKKPQDMKLCANNFNLPRINWCSLLQPTENQLTTQITSLFERPPDYNYCKEKKNYVWETGGIVIKSHLSAVLIF